MFANMLGPMSQTGGVQREVPEALHPSGEPENLALAQACLRLGQMGVSFLELFLVVEREMKRKAEALFWGRILTR